MLNYPALIESLSTSCFKSLTDHFIYFGAPRLGTYILITATSSWWVAPSITTHHLSLFLFHFLTWSLFFLVWIWQYMLFFWLSLAWNIIFRPLTLMWAEVSLLEAAYCSSCFSIQLLTFYFLIDKFNHLHFGWLLINEHLVLPFAFCFQVAVYLQCFFFLIFLPAMLVWCFSTTFFYFFILCFFSRF